MTLIFSEKCGGNVPVFRQIKRGHPVSVVQAGHHRVQQIDRQSALQTAEKDNTDQSPFNKRQWNLTNQCNTCMLLREQSRECRIF